MADTAARVQDTSQNDNARKIRPQKTVRNKLAFVEAELAEREQTFRKRQLRSLEPIGGARVRIDGRVLLNFCSNDYLGLSKHPLLRQRAAEFAERFGSGATASRLICGTFSFFDAIEKRLAELKKTETSLIFNSGYQANVAIIPALAGPDSLILSDRLNHNSLIQGARLSKAKVVVFDHGDLDHLCRLLQTHSGYRRKLVITESVFSMDGDRTDMDRLVAIAEQFDALLFVDEAHATGVLGPNGMGLTCGKKVDLAMGTFSKGCGSFGAYVACSQKIKDYLINKCPGIIYSTALPPTVAGSISAALELIPGMEAERKRLHESSEFVRSSLAALGWSSGSSSTPIIPVVVGPDRDTLELSGWLERQGILGTAIRPPTVEEGKSRIRLTVSAAHSGDDLRQLVSAFEQWPGRNTGGRI